MAKDNTLGAPTEGLGQTVTFALGNSGGTPQMQADQRQMLRNEARGGFAMQAKQAQFIPDREAGNTFQLLAKLGGEALKPHIEQERTAAYVRGMQQAAQGEAIGEIVSEQPTFSKLFGSTSLVDGARAYTASAKAASTAANLEADMPKLRQMAPEEFAKVAAERMLSASTGDAATDMIVQQQMAQSLPGVMKMQAKEHLKFKVDQLNSSIDSSLTAAFAQIGAADTASRDPQSVRDRLRPLELQAQVVSQLVPPADMDPAHYDKLLAKAAGEAVRGGNFAVLNMLESSGRLQSMSADAQSYIQQAGYRARIEAKAKLPLEFAIKQAEWEDLPFDPNGNEDEITKRAEALNAEYTRLTGDTQPYLPTGTVARNLQERSRLERLEVAKKMKAIEEANKPDAKALAKAEEAMGAIAALGNNAILDSYSKEAIGAAFKTVPPEALPFKIVRQYGGNVVWKDKQDAIQASIAMSLEATGNPQQLAKVYTEFYAPVTKAAGEMGTSVADTYVGKYAKVMQRYHEAWLMNERSNGVLREDEIYAMAVTPPPPPAPLEGKNAKAKVLEKALDPSRFARLMKDDYVAPANPQQMVDTLWQFYDTKYEPDTALKEAIRKAEANGYGVMGGHIWKAQANSTPLKDYLNQRDSESVQKGERSLLGANEFNQAFDLTLKKTAKLMNMDSVVEVHQIADGPNNMPRLYIKGIGKDGQSLIGIVQGKDIEDNWAAKKESDKWKASDLQAGPKLTNVPSDDMPSPYASAEEWKAYRERQKQKK